MRLNNQLQNIFNTSINPLDESCLEMENVEINSGEWMQKFPRLSGSCRYKGQPRVHLWLPEVLAMWTRIHKSLEAGFQMYIAVIPCMDYVRPVIVMGVGYKYDEKDIMKEGEPVCWCYQGSTGGDILEIDLITHAMPQPLTHIDFGFQPNENNIKVRLNNVLGEKVVEVLNDADGALRDVFEEMLEVPKVHTNDHQYWFDRMELVHNIKHRASVKSRKFEEKYNDLRMLIASRIQADGSKYMFKAKHLVDLPKDFYEKLEPHIFPKD